MALELAVLSSNIVTVPTNRERVPPDLSGSPEMIMLQIADGMVRRGHKVTLFATGESSTLANLEFVAQKSSCEDPQVGFARHKEYEYKLIERCYDLAQRNQFDLVHSRFITESADYASTSAIPTISTLHTPLSHFQAKDLRRAANAQNYVSISFAQRRGFDFLNYSANIYHGLSLENFPFEASNSSDLVFVGRIHPEKGPEVAIEVAQRLGIKLEMVGGKSKYWSSLEGKLDPSLISSTGFIDNKEVASHFGRAKASLAPIQWEEPFGLTVIESMAAGTPVIAFARGSIPELIVDGLTGFLVNPSEEDKRGNWITKASGSKGFEEAINRLYGLSPVDYTHMRRMCRERVEANFTLERMLDEYEKTYLQLITLAK